MTLDELSSLDFKSIPDWPIASKLVVLGLLSLSLVGLGWWFMWKDGLTAIDAAKQQEETLRATFVTKKNQAVNLEAYRKQFEDIQQAFGALLKQLPNKQEMDALITDINQAGLGRGLQFELFRPETEAPLDFYAQTPIKVKVTGSYHDVALFASDIAKLPRIVTMHDISMAPIKDGLLNMDATVKTYRYLDEDEIKAQQPAAGATP